MINALANVNEISHVLGYKNFLQKKKNLLRWLQRTNLTRVQVYRLG